jgi:hypothetical protein
MVLRKRIEMLMREIILTGPDTAQSRHGQRDRNGF